MSGDYNTKEIILKAAETEFMEKGYAGTRTTSVAKKAGVTHSMLHYYFHTKENLFKTVFTDKIKLLTKAFSSINDNKDLTFSERVRSFVERHFEFIEHNPNLWIFMYSEIVNNKQNRSLLLDTLSPVFEIVLSKVNELINEEVNKKNIRPVNALDLIINIVSVNTFTFMALPFINNFKSELLSNEAKRFLKERREANVQFILSGLKP